MLKRVLSRFFLGRNQPEWFVRDTCGRICAYITWGLILWGQFVVFYVILPPWFWTDSLRHDIIMQKVPRDGGQIFDSHGRVDIQAQRQRSIQDKQALLLLEEHNSAVSQDLLGSSLTATLHGILFFILSLFAMTAHVRAMFSDPGVTELNNADPESIAAMNLPSGTSVYKCTKCSAIKPTRAHHCSTCRRCIKRMDHHCPWINNCVGENNQKYFVLFTFYICAISLHALVMVVMRFFSCTNHSWKSELCSVRSPAMTAACLISLTFEACLFFLFTAIMFCTQVYAICADETGIEQLKGDMSDRQHRSNTKTKKSKMLNFKSVFGDKVSIKWAIPFATPEWAKRDMSLYCV